jgi:hypothetical protein
VIARLHNHNSIKLCELHKHTRAVAQHPRSVAEGAGGQAARTREAPLERSGKGGPRSGNGVLAVLGCAPYLAIGRFVVDRYSFPQ